ncbi:hypothetical protein ACFVGV_06260 [Pseudarthrobacter scleromae]|uniref:hypothetical protein n=1 Tax=Pseudarthrobacter scleromae TaxID=158897 RepID=UPI00363506BB
MSPKGSKPPEDPVVTSHFKFVVKIILGLTVGAGLTYAGIGLFIPAPTEAQMTIMNAAGYGWTTGSGAIFGLLGGKALN